MKKIVLVIIVAASIAGMASCATDDSNDIEIIKPGDTTIVGKATVREMTTKKTLLMGRAFVF